jgi:hypothetical protein
MKLTPEQEMWLTQMLRKRQDEELAALKDDKNNEARKEKAATAEKLKKHFEATGRADPTDTKAVQEERAKRKEAHLIDAMERTENAVNQNRIEQKVAKPKGQVENEKALDALTKAAAEAEKNGKEADKQKFEEQKKALDGVQKEVRALHKAQVAVSRADQAVKIEKQGLAEATRWRDEQTEALKKLPNTAPEEDRKKLAAVVKDAEASVNAYTASLKKAEDDQKAKQQKVVEVGVTLDRAANTAEGKGLGKADVGKFKQNALDAAAQTQDEARKESQKVMADLAKAIEEGKKQLKEPVTAEAVNRVITQVVETKARDYGLTKADGELWLAHFMSRHGPRTTADDHINRVATGVPADKRDHKAPTAAVKTKDGKPATITLTDKVGTDPSQASSHIASGAAAAFMLEDALSRAWQQRAQGLADDDIQTGPIKGEDGVLRGRFAEPGGLGEGYAIDETEPKLKPGDTLDEPTAKDRASKVTRTEGIDTAKVILNREEDPEKFRGFDPVTMFPMKDSKESPITDPGAAQAKEKEERKAALEKAENFLKDARKRETTARQELVSAQSTVDQEVSTHVEFKPVLEAQKVLRAAQARGAQEQELETLRRNIDKAAKTAKEALDKSSGGSTSTQQPDDAPVDDFGFGMPDDDPNEQLVNAFRDMAQDLFKAEDKVKRTQAEAAERDRAYDKELEADPEANVQVIRDRAPAKVSRELSAALAPREGDGPTTAQERFNVEVEKRSKDLDGMQDELKKGKDERVDRAKTYVVEKQKEAQEAKEALDKVPKGQEHDAARKEKQTRLDAAQAALRQGERAKEELETAATNRREVGLAAVALAREELQVGKLDALGAASGSPLEKAQLALATAQLGQARVQLAVRQAQAELRTAGAALHAAENAGRAARAQAEPQLKQVREGIQKLELVQKGGTPLNPSQEEMLARLQGAAARLEKSIQAADNTLKKAKERADRADKALKLEEPKVADADNAVKAKEKELEALLPANKS